MTDLETRLRDAMGRPLPEGDPDPADWDAIEHQIWAGDQGPTPAPTRPPGRRRYLLAVAAVVIVALAGLAGRLTDGVTGRLGGWSTADSAGVPPEATGPVSPPAVPSIWWLVALVVVGIAATFVAERVWGDRLLAVAISAAATAPVVMGFLVWPYYGAVGGLVEDAPDIEGYELAAADLDLWPGGGGYGLVELRYLAARPGPTGGGQPAAVTIDPEALGFDARFPGTARPCLRIGIGVHDSRYYCLSEGDDRQLIVMAGEYRDMVLFWPRLFGYPLLGLAAILFLLRVAEERGLGAGRRPWEQWSYGVALMLMGVALYFVWVFARSVIEVGRVSADGLCGPGRSPLGDRDCSMIVDDHLVRRGVYESSNLLYGPAVFFGNMFALAGLGGAWLMGLAGQPSRRRRILLWALTGLVAIGIVIELSYSSTISVLTDFHE